MGLTNTNVPSGESSHDTKRGRYLELSRVRNRLSRGDVSQQLAEEMKMLPREERRKLMREAKFAVHDPPEQGLVIKADLKQSLYDHHPLK